MYMKRLLTVLFILICTFSSPAQDWRYMKGKKLYTSLEEAQKNPSEVYNLSLGGRDLYKKDISGIREMVNLRYLALFDAELEQLPPGLLDKLTELRTLNLVQNSFIKFPNGIRKLRMLEYLVMYDNEIDSIPDWIGELNNLETLILPRNKLVFISPAIGKLKKLKDLSVGDNRIKNLPDELGDLNSLEILELNENELTSIPETVTRLTNLQGLHLNNNQLVKLPDNIGLLLKLETLQLGVNKLKSLPHSIQHLTSLDHIGLERNPDLVFDKDLLLPVSLTQINLEKLNITEFPDCLQPCINLELIELTQTRIENIPDWFARFTKLSWLILDDNRIKSVPAFLEKLDSLEILRLSGNQLDSVPAGIFLLPKLRGLSIGDNPVKHIPSTIALSTSLEWFNMNGTAVSYQEFKAMRKMITRKMEIGHDSPYFFDEEDQPCYTENPQYKDAKTFIEQSYDPGFKGGWGLFDSIMHAQLNIGRILQAFPIAKTDSVELRFVILKKGGFCNFRYPGSPDPVLKEEVDRMMKETCKYWIPAQTGGRYINGYSQLVFTFIINPADKDHPVIVHARNPLPARPRDLLLEKD
jgi:Leucine-rich repeat (LRR) protein